MSTPAATTHAAPPIDARPQSRWRHLLADYGIFIAFAVLCMVLGIVEESFLTWDNWINVLRQTSINAILAIGMTCVILTRGIDLSVGSLLAFSGLVAASFASGSSANLPLALAAGLGAGLLLGMLNGALVARLSVQPFVVTLGMLSMARGLTFIYNDGMPIAGLAPSMRFIGQGMVGDLPVPVLILAVTFALFWFILKYTAFGRYIYAVGGNEKSARTSGIRTKWVIFWVYAISGLLSALAGIILAARTTSALPQAGVAYELDAIAAVVIGGTSLTGGVGTLTGTLVGALIIGVINNGLDLLGVSSYYQQVIKGVIIVAAVLLDASRKKQA
ncbi:ABC transporter permease [Verminephrobacter aporrectodeae subsp. tuberculatae]|uniref:ABC transporter permease n=1 Tax=Verminephrobacter aporrectodeae subsp. tuberculatae TaxID=1110392 RepID=A0ABT3KPF7_9BURK|nr:ABC transporter permease [Verminephrobacter aporrectodeae subsp. tuberculatae]